MFVANYFAKYGTEASISIGTRTGKRFLCNVTQSNPIQSGGKLHEGPLHLPPPGGGQQEEECDPLLLGDAASRMLQTALSLPASAAQGSSQVKTDTNSYCF